MPPVQILVIDHHAAFMASMLTFLKLHSGFQVVATAADGEQGLIEAQAAQLDVVLVGLELRGFSGLNTISRLRSLLPTTGIIALALNDQDSYQRAARLAGADGFVSKLHVIEDLVPTIQQVTQSRLIDPERQVQP